MTGIFYGSSTGTTEDIAKQIAAALGVDASDVRDIAKANAEDVQKYDTLLFGASTWGYGDLQDDWEGFLPKLAKVSLAGKKVGLFGCGDCESYPDTFCDSIGLIREGLASTGCQFVGEFDAAGYSVTDSKAFEGGKALGLAIDEVNEGDKTKARMDAWIAAL